MERSRLVILRLELENFKSYGGKVSVGPFHNNFSSIVGPNGSGKSNVIDAMLFVFGKRAKQMRLAKISELIHNSATISPPPTSASVTVYFGEIPDVHDSAAVDVIDGSEFAITRTAFKNNTSKYFIDGKVSSFTAVTELLRAKDVDLENNRFLILQGEVEQIAMMKPKGLNEHEDGLLEYLEDIIGTNGYVEKLETAVKQVEEINEVRTMKLNRVKAVEKERSSLAEAKDEALEYLKKERELWGHRLRLARMNVFEIRGAIEETERSLIETSERLETERRKVEELCGERQRQEFDKRMGDAQREYDASSRHLRELREEFSRCERQDIQCREEIKHLKNKEKKLASRKKKEETDLSSIEASIVERKQHVVELEEALRKARPRQAKAEEKLSKETERVRISTADLRHQVETLQSRLKPFHERIALVEKERNPIESEKELLLEKIQEPERGLEKGRELNHRLQTEYREAMAEYQKLQSEEVSAKDDISDLERERANLSSKSQALSSQASHLRRRLEAAKESASAVTSRGRLVSSLSQACQEGRLSGVYGQLSELGAIDEKYDAAVGAAAGGSLRHIVVASTEEAQRCVEYLREKNLGRATFIILEKIQYLSCAMSRVPRDGTMRVFDLVRVADERFRIAFYFALRDTLLAKDIEEATRLAYQPTRRNRVVTEKGELIETSGAMTGGGREAPRAGLGRDIRSVHGSTVEDIPGLTRDLQSIHDQMRISAASLDKVQSELDSKNEMLRKIESDISKLSANITSFKSRIGNSSDQIAELESRLRRFDSHKYRGRLEELDRTLENLSLEVSRTQAESEPIVKEISRLEEEIIAVGGAALQKASENVRIISEEIESMISDLSQAHAQLAAADESIGKKRGNLETMEKDAAHMLQEKLDLAKRLSAIEDQAVELTKEIESSEVMVDEKAQSVQLLVKERRKLDSMVSEFRKVEVEIENELKDLEKTKRTQDARAERFEAEVEKLRASKPKSLSGGDDNDEDMDEAFDPSQMEEKTQCIASIGLLEESLGQMIPDMNAIAEYERVDCDFEEKTSELRDITTKRDNARLEHETLRKRRLDEFMEGFTIISAKLKEMYQMITLGGDADLELVDSLDPFSEGIVFSVRPPKKSWKNISNLSGGEKTLSSLALVFALHHYKPTPLYFMDEIDAALDFRNVSIVANYVKERTKNAQFIIISLRNNMFELADRLVGIYKTHHTTKSVTIDPTAFVVGTRTPTPTSIVI